MAVRRRAYFWIFLLVLAPVGAVVMLSALLLLGVPAHLVFAPGRAVQSALASMGLHAANRVGVMSTGLICWAIIAAIGVLWERRAG